MVPDVYAVVPDASLLPVVMPVLMQLRAAGVQVQMHAGISLAPSSMKSQFKKADASGARYALIFGADEVGQGMVAIKPLRSDSAAPTKPQWAESLNNVPAWAASLLT